VHALWKGLGYYRRAGFLLAAAKKVRDQYEGHIPEDIKVMQKEVPGMGRYTAGTKHNPTAIGIVHAPKKPLTFFMPFHVTL
jgi:endonuclease III